MAGILAPFDPSRDFEVRRKDFLCAGIRYQPGAAFDKASVTPRLLEQLYHGRMIAYAQSKPDLKPIMIPTPAPVEPQGPTVDERIAALVANNTKTALLEMAAKAGLHVDRITNKPVIAAAIVQANADGAD